MQGLTKILIFSIIFLFCVAPSYSREKYKAASPTKGNIASGFGFRTDPFNGKWAFHSGIDIAADANTPVYALQEGRVIYSGWKGGYGNCVIIDHNYPDIPGIPRVQTKYGHNAKNLVKVGDYVYRGQVISYVGSTGRSTGPHLHFEVVYNGNAINPLDYLYKLPAYLDYVAYVRDKQRYTSHR